ncbi:uncharacterized protein BDW70DRAFT_146282 [Aspergillus foveolatus]|uniref:uncharacterized protein n=1 Tax=Aspergillus foveolatus TaxID=210207 RepID=UPI003CCE1DC4
MHYSAERTQRVRPCLRAGSRRVRVLEIDAYPPGYLLRPVAILGPIAVRAEEKEFRRDFITSISLASWGGRGLGCKRC